MSIQNYESVWVSNWHTDPNGNKVNISITNEQHVVVDSQFVLNEIPDEFYKVTFVSPSNMVEIKSSQAITTIYQYKVNYNYGIVTVHPSLEADSVTVNYQGRGVQYISANRVFTELNESGTTVLSTVQDAVDLINTIDTSLVATGNYNNNYVYSKRNTALYNGSSYEYINSTPSSGHLPTDANYWRMIAQAGSNLQFRGLYDPLISYAENSIVTYNNENWRAKQSALGITPSAGAYWEIFSMIHVDTLKNTITLSGNQSYVDINIPSFDKETDTLLVYQNGTFIQEGIEYNISNYQQGRLNKVSGYWNDGTVFDVLIFKNYNNLLTFTSGSVIEDGTISLGKLDNSLQDIIQANASKVVEYRGSTTITYENSTDTIDISAIISSYDYNTDSLLVFVNSTFQQEIKSENDLGDYSRSLNNIVKSSGTWGGDTAGDLDVFNFIIYKSISDIPTTSFSGGLITDGTVSNVKLVDSTLKELGNNNILNLIEQSSTPDTPNTGYNRLYFKNDGKLYKLNDSGNEICLENIITTQDIGLVGDDSTNDATALNTWITSIGTTKVDLVILSGTYKIATNVTFPRNVNLIFMNGAMFKVYFGYSITGTNTKINAGLYQIFDLSLGGVIGGNWDITEAYPQWFGALGDNINDDTNALQYAINFNNKVILPKGTYKHTGIQLKSNSILEGAGTLSILKNTSNSANITIGNKYALGTGVTGISRNWTLGAQDVTTVTTSIDNFTQKLTITNANTSTTSKTIETTIIHNGGHIKVPVKYKTSNAYARIGIVSHPSETMNTVTNLTSEGSYTESIAYINAPTTDTSYTIYLGIRAINIGDTGSVWFEDINDELYTSNTKISNLMLNSDANASNTSNHGIEFVGVNPSYSIIDNVHIFNCGNHGIYGGHGGHVNNVEIKGCYINGCRGDGINMQYGAGQINAIWIHNNNIVYNYSNGILFFGNNVVVEQNTIQANAYHAISISNTTLDTVKACYGSSIRKNYTEQNCSAVVSNASIIGLYTCYEAGSPTTNKVCRHLDISDNYFVETGAKYVSVINSYDLKTSDPTSKNALFTTSNNHAEIPILTYNKDGALSQGVVIDERFWQLVPTSLTYTLPSWVEVRGFNRIPSYNISKWNYTTRIAHNPYIAGRVYHIYLYSTKANLDVSETFGISILNVKVSGLQGYSNDSRFATDCTYMYAPNISTAVTTIITPGATNIPIVSEIDRTTYNSTTALHFTITPLSVNAMQVYLEFLGQEASFRWFAVDVVAGT